MRGQKRGSLTIFMAFSMLVFLTFSLVLVEGVRNYYIRTKAAQAMELTEFSILSEYQKELFENYGVFFLDLDYEQGRESVSVLEQRASYYLNANLPEARTEAVLVQNFRRATDGEGAAFFVQATELMKVRSGYTFLDDLIENLNLTTEEDVDLNGILKQNTSFSELLPNISFPSITGLWEAVFGSSAGISEKSILLSERLLNRSLEKGSGNKDDFSGMQLFYAYLFEHCNYYGAKNESVSKEVLEYQMEYIIAGKDSDRKNLEQIMWKIFLLRAGGNYLFFHQDAQAMAAAEAQAVLFVGFTGNPAIIEACREILLISRALEEGVSDTRKIFGGEKVPLYNNGVFGGMEIGYEQYLYLFLNTTGRKEKIYRCMDVVELEIRKKSGYEKFRLDHCADTFLLQWDYGFDSLFMEIPWMDQSIYENRMIRNVYYEN